MVFANQAMADITGYSVQELVALSPEQVYALVHPDDRETVRSRHRRRMAGQTVPPRYEFRCLRKDGGVCWLEAHASLIDYAGRPAVQAAYVDITSRKQAEESLRTSEDRYRSLFDNAVLGIYRTTPDGRILAANPALLRMLGYDRLEDLTRRNLEEEGFEAGYSRSFFKELMESRGEVIGLESAWTRRDGTTVHIRESAVAIRDQAGNSRYYEGTVEDISDRKQAEAARKLSHRILEISNRSTMREPMLQQIVLEIRDFTQCENAAIRILDQDGNIPYEACVGFSREFYERESPLSIQRDQCMCIRVIQGQTDSALPFFTPRGSFFMNGTTRFLAAVPAQEKGQTRNVCNEMGFESVALIPIQSNGQIVGLIHVADRRENRVPLSLVEPLEEVAMQLGVAVRRTMAEEALQQSERDKSLILNSTSEMFAYLTPDLRVQWANRIMEEALGLSQEQIVGRRCYELRHQRTTPCEECPLVEAIKTRKPQEAEIHAPNGQVIFLRGFPLLGEDGQITGLVEVGENITARKQAQEAQRKSEERFRAIFENAAAMVGVVDPAGHWLHINQYMIDLLGYSREEFLQMRFHDTVVPEDLDTGEALLEQLLHREVGQCRLEWRALCKDGRVLSADLSVTPLHDEQGNVEALLGVALNMTDQKNAVRALQESEAKFRAIADYTADLEIWTGPDGQLIWINPAIERFSGYTVSECMAMPDFPASLIHVDDRPRMLGLYQQACAGSSGNDVLYRLLRRDGSFLWMSLSWQPLSGLDGEYLGWRSSHRDVTDRVRAEEALRQSESALLAAQKVAHVGSWSWHIPTGRVEWSEEMFRIFGVSKDDFPANLADIVASTIHPQDREAVNRVNEAVITEYRHSPLEFRIVRPDGSIRVAWAEAGELTLDKHGRPLLLTGIVQDITERKRVEEALRKSRERFRSLYESVQAGIIVQRADGTVAHCNRIACEIFGMTQDAIISRTSLDPGWQMITEDGTPVPGEDHPSMVTIRTGKAVRGEVRGLFAGDPQRTRWLLINTEPRFKGDSEEVDEVIITFQDITEQKRAQQRAEQRQAELLHVSRLSTLGEMASGFAHELNQPLSAIMSYGSASLRSVRTAEFDVDRLAANLGHIVAQSGRAGEIIRRIRAFAQRRPLQLGPLDLNGAVREAIDLLGTTIRHKGVELTVDLSEDLPPVLGDSIQIEQVLLNLMRNAIEAMEAVAPPRRRLALRSFAPSNDAIRVTVSDTGPGMSEETAASVFNAFFTTKENGLGIGLSISRSIIESHRGQLWVTSSPGEGCTFTFTLPAALPSSADSSAAVLKDPEAGSTV